MSTDASPPQAVGFEGFMKHASQHKGDMVLWITRFLCMWFTFFHFVPIIRFGQPAYNLALITSTITSGLRLYQRQPSISLSKECISKFLGEDSFHYLAFSILFSYTRPVSLALMPLFLFSLLHFSSYSLTLMNLFGANSMWPCRLAIHLVEFQSMTILHLAALSEILLMPYLIILVLSWQLSLFVVIVYYEFLNLRCRSRRNPYTRNMFHKLRMMVNSFACSPGVPSVVRMVLLESTRLISKLGFYTMDGQ